jgi:competence protein ComEA
MTQYGFPRSFFAIALASLASLGALGAITPASVDAQARHAQVATSAPSADASADGVVNIQTASAEELQRLPGIGPSKAAAIIAFRERTAFRRVEDILRVRGIGRATFRRLRPYLSVSGATTLAAEVATQRATPDAADDGDDESP